MAGCVTTPFGAIGVNFLGAAMNWFLRSRELSIYKDHKDNLEDLSDINEERFNEQHAFDQEIKGLHTSVYDAMDGLPEARVCCENSYAASVGVNTKSMWQYQDSVESLSGYQSPHQPAYYMIASRGAGRAVAAQSRVMNEYRRRNQDTIAARFNLIAGSPSPRNIHNTLSGILGEVAEDRARDLNIASALADGLNDQAMQQIGYAYATYTRAKTGASSASGAGQSPSVIEGNNIALGANIDNPSFDSSQPSKGIRYGNNSGIFSSPSNGLGTL